MPLPALPSRDALGHKGTFGTVCVVGGQARAPRVMIGGPAFSAAAALRAGAGLAVLAVPEPILTAALTIAPGATGLALPTDHANDFDASGTASVLDEHLTGRTCVAIGPGFGHAVPQQQIIVRLLTQDDRLVVVDADALNAMAAIRDIQNDVRATAVLTPHPGEYARLARALGIEGDPTDPAKRPDAAAELARRLGCIVALKGPGTVVSDGHRTEVNETGNAALATAGSGDVLTGIVASFLVQFAHATLDAFACTRLAVHVHGRVADRWAEENGEAGLTARDLIDGIPSVLSELRH